MSDYQQQERVRLAHPPNKSQQSAALTQSLKLFPTYKKKQKMARGFSAAWIILERLGICGDDNQALKQTYSNWQTRRDQAAELATSYQESLSGLDTMSNEEVIHLIKHQANLAGQSVRAEVLSLSANLEKAYGLIHQELARGHQVILHTDVHSLNANDYFAITALSSQRADLLFVQQDSDTAKSSQSFQEFSELLGSPELSRASQLLVFSH